MPRTERFVWAGLVAAVALSLQWGPTHLLWHAFATPNGSPFRQTFVLSGLVVIAAWLSVATAWPDRRTLLGGAGVLVLIAAGAASSTLITGWTYPLFAAGLLAVTGALALARSGRFAVLAALLLIGAQAGQAAATTAYADRQRLNRLDDYAPWGERQTLQTAAVAGCRRLAALPHRPGPGAVHRQRPAAGGRAGRRLLQQSHTGCADPHVPRAGQPAGRRTAAPCTAWTTR